MSYQTSLFDDDTQQSQSQKLSIEEYKNIVMSQGKSVEKGLKKAKKAKKATPKPRQRTFISYVDENGQTVEFEYMSIKDLFYPTDKDYDYTLADVDKGGYPWILPNKKRFFVMSRGSVRRIAESYENMTVKDALAKNLEGDRSYKEIGNFSTDAERDFFIIFNHYIKNGCGDYLVRDILPPP